jgi:hypothetical protein
MSNTRLNHNARGRVSVLRLFDVIPLARQQSRDRRERSAAHIAEFELIARPSPLSALTSGAPRS